MNQIDSKVVHLIGYQILSESMESIISFDNRLISYNVFQIFLKFLHTTYSSTMLV